ncbi:MAG TPA: glycosyltransferase family 4 protein [Azospirillaceae bacterium]|nr:glycosyltransferase family 4 protein [Azospirillaceae bacterium]
MPDTRLFSSPSTGENRKGRTGIVVVIGPLPPPMHGMARVTALMVERLRAHVPVRMVNTSPGFTRGGFRYHIEKMLRVIGSAAVLVGNAGRRGRRAYLPADGGVGMLYTALLAGLARWLGYRLFIHYHTYAHITRRNARMTLLALLAGPHARHIVLCRTMRREFLALYPQVRRCLVVSNAIFTPPAARVAVSRDGPLVLGHLSNLCREKGLDVLFDLLRALRAEGVAARLVLAGPGLSVADREVIAGAIREFGDALDYRGPLFDGDKDAFYRTIDVFVFPTRNEAQPVVVFEALAAGVPVLAWARGCLAEDLGRGIWGEAVAVGADFTAVAVPRLKLWAVDRDALARAAWASLKHARTAHIVAGAGLSRCLSLLSGTRIRF